MILVHVFIDLFPKGMHIVMTASVGRKRTDLSKVDTEEFLLIRTMYIQPTLEKCKATCQQGLAEYDAFRGVQKKKKVPSPLILWLRTLGQGNRLVRSYSKYLREILHRKFTNFLLELILLTSTCSMKKVKSGNVVVANHRVEGGQCEINYFPRSNVAAKSTVNSQSKPIILKAGMIGYVYTPYMRGDREMCLADFTAMEERKEDEKIIWVTLPRSFIDLQPRF